MAIPQATKLRPWALAAALALAVLAAYGNSFDVPFQFDDDRNIVRHQAIRSLLPTTADGENLLYRRPIGRLSLWLNYSLHGLDVRGYHVFNVAVHVAAAIVLLDLVRRTLRLPALVDRFGRDADWLALVVALVWALHPLQVQSVTYIIQRLESLMGLFFLLTLYCLLRSRDSARPWLWQLSAIAACSLSIGTKEVGVMAPLVALALDRTLLAGSWREIMRRRMWMYAGFLPALVWFATTMSPGNGQFERLSKGITAWEYLCSQPGVILYYLRLAFWPDTLVLDYGWPVAGHWMAIVVPGSVVAGLLFATLVALRRWPATGFLGLSFFLILAPTSSLMPIQDLAFEHRMYLPLAPLASLVVCGSYAAMASLTRGDRLAWRRWQHGALVATMMAAIALAVRTGMRNDDWRDPLRLWAQNARDAPRSYRAWGNLARCLLDRGQVKPAGEAVAKSIALKELPWTRELSGTIHLAAGQPALAVGQFQRAFKLKPELSSLLGAGRCYYELGDYGAAERVYRQAIERNPQSADAQDGLARALAQLERDEQAIVHFQAACAAEPREPKFPVNFGTFYARRRRYGDAIAQFTEAIRRRPDYAQAHLQLALAQYDRGDRAAATQAAINLLRLRPESQAARQILKKIEQGGTES